MSNALLKISNLSAEFKTEKGLFPAISGVDLTINKGEILCIVGESGSGKTVASLSLMQLIPAAGKITSGEIMFEGRDLLKIKKKEMSRIRGKSIAMIFQDPMMALDPVYTCGNQIIEAVRIYEQMSYSSAFNKAVELLKQVGIPHPERCMNAYPHELSGGMCQRISIAMALSCNPKLLIADEPTTALDVTVQAQILELLKKIRKEMNMSIMLITHDLGVVAEMADRVAVMYAGKVMEEGDVRSIFRYPQHPYTQGLIKSIPHMDQKNKKLYSIDGTVPSISSMPNGCRFSPRCPDAADICEQKEPAMVQANENCKVRCWKQDHEWREGEAG
ncbi:ABC transporter ATP-binding protein [Paenibacillus alginolyticus]|uniref:ABC transporter ATP-binding protein n=1 Tax=Paenibacillus alginolyticus TaxID=59839 RepID=A0ABT4GAM7_9BACL|nr:ABC transporter ATP-binding protein [Paenibacillus alginolyticus]MCY9693239.1 ABC transporter ATP-binding protein [Paenibacillus alginolyticus]MEC0145992.1 ABC transporter ATP-binding protein [Paenibacillus alginolyticus]